MKPPDILAGIVGHLRKHEQALAYRFADVPLPADAVDCDVWRLHGVDDWRRLFETREWLIGRIWVSVAGEQNHRGEITRWMRIGGEGECSTDDCTQLIGAIVAAGELLDTLAAGDTRRC